MPIQPEMREEMSKDGMDLNVTRPSIMSVGKGRIGWAKDSVTRGNKVKGGPKGLSFDSACNSLTKRTSLPTRTRR